MVSGRAVFAEEEEEAGGRGEEEEEEEEGFGFNKLLQPTRPITCANHGNQQD